MLVQGVGIGRWGWHPLADRLARRFQVITVDNRGIGASDTPPGSLTTHAMAKDVLAVLDLQLPILVRDVGDAGPRRVVGTLVHALRDPIEDKLPQVKVPVLVTRGSREPIVPPGWSQTGAQLSSALASVELRGSRLGLLAALQSFGNLAASAIGRPPDRPRRAPVRGRGAAAVAPLRPRLRPHHQAARDRPGRRGAGHRGAGNR